MTAAIRWKGWKRLVSTLSISAILAGTALPSLPAYADGDRTGISTASAATSDLLLHYTMDQPAGTTVTDASGHGNDGVLEGGAAWSGAGKLGGAVDLNGSSAYIKLPNGIVANQHDITIATWVHADSLRTWARVFDFGSSTANWMFLTLNDHTGVTRFATMPQGSSENLLTGPAFPGSNQWQHVAVVISGNTYTLYINGIQASSISNMQNDPSDLGVTTQNFIGKSQFAPDPYFDGKIDDFRIYSRALEGSEVMGLVTDGMSDLETVAYAKNWLTLGDTSQQTQNLNLPTSGPGGATITWASSDPAVVKADGTVTRPGLGESDQTVTLTATIRKGTVQDTKTFTIVVWAIGSKAYTLDIQADQPMHEVSPTLYGIFFEDINYAADGGLYGEMVQNRSFEFGAPLYSWTTVAEGGGAGQVSVQTANPLNENNPKYARLTVATPGGGVGLTNAGYDGLAVQKDAKYNVSLYSRSSNPLQKPLTAQLRSTQGIIYGSCSITGLTADWNKLGCSVTSDTTDTSAKLVILAGEQATIDLDMLSLFPEQTWMNRANGMRYDLAEILDNLNPGFLRFPGGCIVEGGSIENRYRWKNTIGDVAQRKVQPNQWAANYYQSFGIGFDEYFQLAEDIGAEPLPIIFAGQVSCTGNPAMIPLDQLDPYIQDAFDLIEYANGDAATTKWGALRAANGHPEPYNMKYLGVGNELWGQNYLDRYHIFYNALKAKYPEIKLVLSAGAFPADYNFQLAYDWLAKNGNKADLVDEHMYQSPQWFYENVDRYDNYSRSGPKVFVGEYAAHGNGKRNNMESALAEAAFMTGLERNSDVVAMASFAPLLAHEKHTQWTTDLIWFNNHQAFATPNYHVQQLFKQHLGQHVLPTKLTKKTQPLNSANDIKGSILLGSWSTAVEYDDVKVTAADSTVLYSNDFSGAGALTDWSTFRGDWSIADGVLKQTNASTTDARLTLNQGQDWTNYTMTVKARKNSGAEGFLIGFGVKNTNDYYWWNLGGFGNTQTLVEKAVGGIKSTIGKASTKTIASGQWYDMKIVVEGARVRLYLDNELIHDIITVKPDSGPLYSVTTKDEKTGDLIVKVVNTSGNAQSTQLHVNGASYIHSEAAAFELASGSAADENSFSNPEKVKPVAKKVTGVGQSFAYEFPAYSLTVLRLRTSSSPVIEKIEPVALTTKAGTAPKLPAKVKVTKSDGSHKEVFVQWKSVKEYQYGKSGIFEVEGVVKGTYLEAVAHIRVVEPERTTLLSGATSIQAGQTVHYTLGISNVLQSVYASEFLVNYAPEYFEFIKAESIHDAFQITKVEEIHAGQLLIEVIRTGTADKDDKPWLKLQLKSKKLTEPARTTVAVTKTVMTDFEGRKTNLNPGSPLVIEFTAHGNRK